MSEFLHDLGRRVLIFDGATGTNLGKLAQGTRVNILNLTHPDEVRQLHREYIRAGADVIETNTYGASSYRLSLSDERRAADINTQGVIAAREAAKSSKRRVYVAGAVGPIAYDRHEFEMLRHQVEALFDEQMGWIVSAGVDLLVLETFSNPDELFMALKTAKQYGIPIVAQFGKVNEGGESRVNLVTQSQKLVQNGANVVGVNCVNPHTASLSLDDMAAAGTYLSVQPNAGVPVQDQGRILRYTESPQAFAAYVKDLVRHGANLVGGCCNTDPGYIAEISAALENTRPVTRSTAKPAIHAVVRNQTVLERKLSGNQFIVGYEIKAPEGIDTKPTFDVIERLERVNIDVFVCPDHPLNKPTMDSTAIGLAIRQRFPDLELLVTKGVSRRDLTDNLGAVLGMAGHSLNNLCVVYGDSETYNVKVSDVLHEAQKVLFAGTGFSPHGNLDFKLRLLESRVEAGAKFVLVQAMYSEPRINEVYDKLRQRFGQDIDLFFGIYPILSLRNAMYIKSSSPDIEIPDDVITHMGKLDRAGARELGIAEAKRQVLLARELADGLILTQPIGLNPDEIASTVKEILA